MWKCYFVTLFIVSAVVGGVRFFEKPSPVVQVATSDSVFQKVVETKTLRCGYVVYAPGIFRDPNSGGLSGIAHDTIESAARKLGLKVEWVEETTWGLHLEGLKTGRYDMLCAASFSLPSDARWSETVGPLFYSPIGVWVRPNDRRFVGDYAAINDPAVAVSAVDGTIPAILAADGFPKAILVSLPQFSDYSLNMLNVATGKADVTFVEAWQGAAFAAKNPGQIVNVGRTHPLRVYHNYMLVKKGAFELQSMFNTVIRQMWDNGEMVKIVRAYDPYESLLLPAPNYR